jgi:D-glycero-alpha-D-manno-heptose-7-phosphate kinase
MKKISTITQSAQCRIDLAGGTLDLWPLYLYFGELKLVNMAINTKAYCELKISPSKTLEIWVESKDMNSKSRFDSLNELAASLTKPTSLNPLRWVNRLTWHFLKSAGIKSGKIYVKTWSEAPPGSGLGGSSVLGVAVAKAFQKAYPTKLSKEPWAMQQTVRDLEAVEIEHPAGDQDYIPALFGGLLSVKLGPNHRSVKKISPAVEDKIKSRIAILYTGKPHHSGINNWEIFRGYHEGDEGLKKLLKEIHQISATLSDDLEAKNTITFVELVNREWELRRKLGNSVDAPVLSEAWAWAQKLGAVARKGCGAGGGGSIFFIFKNQSERNKAIKTTPLHSEWKWLSV